MKRAAWCVGALLLASGCGSSAVVQAPAPGPSALHFASNASIWFHPKPYVSAPPSNPLGGGEVDFDQLFLPSGSWPQVAAHTSVFGLYAGWVADAPDSELSAAVSFINAHNMSIELESPALQALPTCGNGVEGYVPFGDSLQDLTLTYLRRLKTLGADVAYVKVDEPFFYGTLQGVPGSCDFPVATAAAEVSQLAQIVGTVYPNAQVGDVEPVVNAYGEDVVSALTGWHDAYAAANGKPFPFYIADIDFSFPSWPTLVKSLEVATHGAGLRFGIIYIGDPPDTSDAEWTSKVVSRFETYQGLSGGQPDYVLFQSWQKHPIYGLPETSPTTFTGAIAAYLAATSAGTASGLRR